MKVLGHEFVAMTEGDWECYAGAEEGTLICRLPDRDLLYDPETHVISEIMTEGVDLHQIDWTPSKII